MYVRVEEEQRAAAERRSRRAPTFSPAQAALLGVQRAAGNRATGALLSRTSVVARDPFSAEESSPTEMGSEGTGLGDIACHALPDFVVVGLVRGYFAALYTHASTALVHYLTAGGAVWNFDAAAYFSANPRIRERLAGDIGSNPGVGRRGSLIGRTSSTAPIRQTDYDSEDWRLALGNVDQVDWEILSEANADGITRVRLTVIDPYEWHPGEDRGTRCLHEVMERQKENGAKDYEAQGTAEVELRL